MVRYIKDGAYTIVVDDAGSHDGNEGKEGADGRTSPVTARSNTTRDSRRPSDTRPPGSSSASSRRLSSRAGGTRSGHEGGEEKDKDEELMDGEAVSEDEIDYTSIDFILQNLSFARPKYENDSTHTLQSRKDIAEMISQQVAFYVYCLLQAHINRAESPTILQFGDGFIGCRIIHKLANSGCTNFLRIYCRGEVSANEWRTKGFVADCNIIRLLAKEKPTVIIFAADYYSFHHIYHLLMEHSLVMPETALISATLGFQRRKLYYNFSVPTILRAFVEPGEVQASYRSIPESQAAIAGPPTAASPRTAATGGEEASHTHSSAHTPRDGEADSDESDDEDGESSAPSRHTLSPGEKAAVSLAERTGDVRNLLLIVENYYSLHGVPHDDSRRLALRALTGYTDTSLKDSSMRREGPVLQKKDRLVIKILEKAVLQLYSAVALHFQAELVRRLSPDELRQLAREYIVEVVAMDASLTRFQEEKSIRQRRMARVGVTPSPATPGTPGRTGPAGEGEGEGNGAGTDASMRRMPSRPGTGSVENHSDGPSTPAGAEGRGRGGGGGHNRNAILVQQGSNHFLRHGKAYHPMHESSHINELFLLDDAYDGYTGPGFDYMRQLDSNERKKTLYKGMIPPPLRMTSQDQNGSSDGSAPSSPTPSTPSAMSPINFRRAAAEEISPLRMAHRNLAKL